MSAQLPVAVLKEGTSETKGNQGQRNNITAAKTVAEIVRTSLGPRGMDKMLVDTLDTQVQLRSKSSEKAKYGIDVINGKVADLTSRDMWEPLAVKERVLNAATEAACMILRIDDVIAASKQKEMPKSGGTTPDMDM